MTSYKIIFIGCVAFLLYACNPNPGDINGKSNKNSTELVLKTPVNKPVTNDPLTSIELSKAIGTLNIHGTVHGPDDHIKITISIIDGDSLYAVLTPALGDATMRINQLLLPDGTADGAS